MLLLFKILLSGQKFLHAFRGTDLHRLFNNGNTRWQW